MSKWEKVKLGDVCSIKHGYAFKGKDITSEKVDKILVTPGNFQIGGGLKFSKNKYYTGDIPPEYILKEDSLIVTMTDLSKNGDTLGFSGLIPSSSKYIFLHNQRIGLVNIFSDKVDLNFIYWKMRDPNYQKYIVNSSTGSTVKHTSPTRILEYSFYLPPLEEQKRIAAILSSLDDKIEVNNQINKNLEDQAQALFKSWFVNETQGDYAILSDYIILNPKITLKKGTIAPAIDMKDLSTTSMSVTAAAEKKTYNGGAKFQNSHTLLARITPCLENGKTAFVDFLDEGEIGFGSTEFIVMQAKESVSPYYVYCLARNDDFRNYAIKSMVGSSGRQRVQVDVLENYPISKVSESIFLKFTQYVEPMFKEIRKNTLESQCLAKLREILIPKLMNGEIHV